MAPPDAASPSSEIENESLAETASEPSLPAATSEPQEPVQAPAGIPRSNFDLDRERTAAAVPRMKIMTRARQFEILGVSRSPRFEDLYLQLLARPWRWTIGLIVVFLLFQNLAFALAYMASGGIEGTTTLTSDFARAFFFSVETLGTIGYGTMYPTNLTAHLLVTAESITGILSIALITGVIFAKFSRIRARVIFSRVACISLVDGVPTLMIRVANERGNYIADATVSLTLLRIGKTKEGHQLARMQDLKLVRDRSPAFTRTWLVMHQITQDSPLYGVTPQSLRDAIGELIVSFAGVDNVSSQGIHAVDSYLDHEILWGHRFRDMMIVAPSGKAAVDMAKFHESEAMKAAEGFPYP